MTRTPALVLSLMTLPVIIISSRAAITAVPQSIRDGALALGAAAVLFLLLLAAAGLDRVTVSLDSLRPERFEQFLLACEADIRGRAGKENDPVPYGDHFRRLLEAANAISVAHIREAGFEGRAIGEELHQRRVNAVKQALREIRA